MIIAHDLGTSGNKATVHNEQGLILASASASYPTRYGPQGESEQNPEHWWQAVVESTRKLLTKADVDSSRIRAICISGQMMGVVSLDSSGRVIRPALIWSDQRAHPQSIRLLQRLGSEESYRQTGHRIAATYNIAKLMWLKDNEPQNYRQIYRTCTAKDYVNFRLCGQIATDYTDASSTGMYDLLNRCWSAQILEQAEISETILPELVPSQQILGTLLPGAAAELGLPPQTVVVVGAGDGPVATIGAGCATVGDMPYTCLGTSAWFSATTKTPVLDEQQRSFTFNHVSPELYCPCSTTQNGAGVLEWMARILEPERGLEALPELISQACELAPRSESHGPMFLPYLLGERSPWWNPTARGAWIGLDRSLSRVELVRAVLEGIALNLALCLEPLRSSQDLTEGVAVIGGAARNDQLLQLFSDVWGIPVHRRRYTTDANSLGAALIGLSALGDLDLGVAGQINPFEHSFYPGEYQDIYREKLERLVRAYHCLQPWNELEKTEFPKGGK